MIFLRVCLTLLVLTQSLRASEKEQIIRTYEQSFELARQKLQKYVSQNFREKESQNLQTSVFSAYTYVPADSVLPAHFYFSVSYFISGTLSPDGEIELPMLNPHFLFEMSGGDVEVMAAEVFERILFDIEGILMLLRNHPQLAKTEFKVPEQRNFLKELAETSKGFSGGFLVPYPAHPQSRGYRYAVDWMREMTGIEIDISDLDYDMIFCEDDAACGSSSSVKSDYVELRVPRGVDYVRLPFFIKYSADPADTVEGEDLAELAQKKLLHEINQAANKNPVKRLLLGFNTGRPDCLDSFL